MKVKLYFFGIILAVFAILWPLFSHPGFPYTHDGQNHLARISNYYLALKQGQFPPRWAPNLDAGLGYTSLNFNYPLANILALPLIAVNLGVENSLIFLFYLFLTLSGLGMFYLLKERYDNHSSFLGAIAYLVNPYQLSNIFVRGNIGESMSFGLLPWVILYANKIIQQNKSKLNYPIFLGVFSAFLLTHNLIAVLSLPFIFLILFLLNDFKSLKVLLRPVLISILIVSFFWIPALVEVGDTVLGSSPLSTANFTSHFPTLRQLIFSSWDHGFSYPVNVDGMSFSLGILGIIGVLLAIPSILVVKKKPIYEISLLSIFILLIFLMTTSSLGLWQLFPQLYLIQFPWRLLFFTTFISSFLLAFSVSKIKPKIVINLLVFLVFIFTLSQNLGVNYLKFDDNYWFSFPLNTTILNENDPIWLDRNLAYDIKDQSSQKVVSSTEADIQILSWTGSKRSYRVKSDQAITITEKTIYFPGWQVKVDGQKINLKESAWRRAGLINYDLKPGEHLITTKFSQRTPARIIGNSLSILGLVLGLLLSRFKFKKV